MVFELDARKKVLIKIMTLGSEIVLTELDIDDPDTILVVGTGPEDEEDA